MTGYEFFCMCVSVYFGCCCEECFRERRMYYSQSLYPQLLRESYRDGRWCPVAFASPLASKLILASCYLAMGKLALRRCCLFRTYAFIFRLYFLLKFSHWAGACAARKTNFSRAICGQRKATDARNRCATCWVLIPSLRNVKART